MRASAQHKIEHLAGMEAQRHTRTSMPLSRARTCPQAPLWACPVLDAPSFADFRMILLGLSDAQTVAWLERAAHRRCLTMACAAGRKALLAGAAHCTTGDDRHGRGTSDHGVDGPRKAGHTVVNLRVTQEDDEYDIWVPLSVRVPCNPTRNRCVPGLPNRYRVEIGRDSRI